VKRELVVTLRHEHGLSERRACAAVNLRRSVNRYRCRPNHDGELVTMLFGVGPSATGGRISKAVQAIAAPGLALESQTRTSRVLQPETEQKTERQKTFANKMSFTASGT